MTDRLNLNDVRRAISRAHGEIDTGDEAVRMAADLIVGRLRVSKVRGSALAELKRELRDFNMTTYRWKDDD